MKILITTILSLLLTSQFVLADTLQEQLKSYNEKMEYWFKRSDSAFKCNNRFELAMFIYDATFEEGAHPSEELARIIEENTLNNMQCVIKSLKVHPKEKLNKVINIYYKVPNFREPGTFSQLINELQANNGVN